MSPDRRKHRGPHPKDAKLFSEKWLNTLRQATTDLSWLFSRGYATKSSVKLVGDRYQLTERQRIAVRRAACSDAARVSRRSRETGLDNLNRVLVIDGFNVLVTVEAGLAGGVLLLCRDGALRDLASMHGSYRKVEETIEAIRLIANVLGSTPVERTLWLLDRPVSNSGRLAAILREFAEDVGQAWDVELVYDVDAELLASKHPVATSDSHVLDDVGTWINLAAAVIEQHVSEPWVIDLSPGAAEST